MSALSSPHHGSQTAKGRHPRDLSRPAPAAEKTPQLLPWRTAWALIKGAGQAWVDDYAPSMGAALSYYTFFSLAPLLLIVVSVAGMIFGQDAARGQLMTELTGVVGAEAAQSIEGLLAAANPADGRGVWATVAGVIAMLVGATTVFGELQGALDRIWRAPSRNRSGGLFSLLRARILSFGMILGLGFLLIVSLVASAAVSALGAWWGPAFAGWEVLAQVINFALGFVLTTGTFAMIYKIMPRVSVAWRDVWIGAVVTAMLFSVGRLLIGLYIGKTGLASAFGAAGSLAVVLAWVYYSAQVFLLGAEFTWVYARTLGSRRDIADVRVAQAEVDAAPGRAVKAVLAPDAPDLRASNAPQSTAKPGAPSVASATPPQTTQAPQRPSKARGRSLSTRGVIGQTLTWMVLGAAAAAWAAARPARKTSPR